MNTQLRKIWKGTLAALVLALLFACQGGLPPEARVQPALGSTANPPLIPHEVDDAEGGSACLECHRTGEMGAPKYPDWHATLTDCKQCHVPAAKNSEPFKPAY